MNKRPMRRVHQADDAVIHADRHVGRQIGKLEFIREGRNTRSGNPRLGSFGCPRPGRRGLGHENPDVIISFLTSKAAGIDAIDFQILARRERWNLATLTCVRIKLPTVITAFHELAVEAAAGKRHAAVRTSMAQRKTPTVPSRATLLYQRWRRADTTSNCSPRRLGLEDRSFISRNLPRLLQWFYGLWIDCRHLPSDL